MKYIIKLKLAAVHQLCDVEEKSTEYTLQIMQDMCKVDLDTTLTYFKLKEEEKLRLKQEVNTFTEFMIKLSET